MAAVKMPKLALGCGGMLLLLVLSLFVTVRFNSEPRPQTNPSPQADALARRMQAAVNHEAWLKTGAVSWSFRGKHQHLWDRQRHLDLITWGDTEVWIDLNTRRGKVKQGGAPVEGEAGEELLAKAWAYWANDSFWLNPVSKAFDEGTTRTLVDLEDGGKGLMVSYESGGVTPGDAYLWILDGNDRPIAWKMWVSIIPIGGLRTGWEEWTQVSTGVWIATSHPLGPLNVTVTEVKAAETLRELVGDADPFAPMYQ